MYNQRKVQLVKKIVISVSCFFLLLVGFSVGLGIGSNKKKETTAPVKKEVVEKKDGLTTRTVNTFLIAYYTKKDLGENRHRYEPLVTTAMYSQLIEEEKQPVNQAYKGYVVNQVLDSSEIYINQEEESAICVVNYKNTQRTKLGTNDGAIMNQSNQQTIKLSFSKQGKRYLVDKIDYITLSTPLITSDNAYNDSSTEDVSSAGAAENVTTSSNQLLPTEESKNESIKNQ